MKSNNHFRYLYVALIVLFLCNSCEKFLDKKPDKNLVKIESSNDLSSLMNHIENMNNSYISGIGELASDNFFVYENGWNIYSNFEINIAPYIWRKLPIALTNWNSIYYNKILPSNIVIHYINNVSFTSISAKNEILGTAYFFRGYSFFDLSQIFSPVYDSKLGYENLGIIIKLSPDVNEVSKRSTLNETYLQIISDLKRAALLLPNSQPLYPTRPYKGSAYAALSRCYMAMGDYKNANIYADSALQLQNTILDYSKIPVRDYAFQPFNKEVIFYSQMSGQYLLNENIMRIDTNLISEYSDEDFRLNLFFKKVADGKYTFVGDYSQKNTATFFNGLTTTEMLLNRAETSVRLGDLKNGVLDIESLLNFRLKVLPNLENLTQDDLLNLILIERRKELVFRGIRWSDLRRLNSEMPINLKKNIGANSYSLNSEELKAFAFRFPELLLERVPSIQDN